MRIRLFETPPDGRLEFVVNVLDKMAESRFGPGCILIDVDSFEEVFENQVMFDLTAKCHVKVDLLASRGSSLEDVVDLFSDDFLNNDLAVRTATAQIIQYRSNSPP